MPCPQFKSWNIHTFQANKPKNSFCGHSSSFLYALFSRSLCCLFLLHTFLLFWQQKSFHMPPSVLCHQLVFCPKYYLLCQRLNVVRHLRCLPAIFIFRSGYPKGQDVLVYFCYLCVCLCLGLQSSQPLNFPHLRLFVFYTYFPSHCSQKASVLLIHLIFLCQLYRPILNSPVILSYVLFFVPPLISDCFYLSLHFS